LSTSDSRLDGKTAPLCYPPAAPLGQMQQCPRGYAERRTKEGLSKPEIMRCVKRYLAREVYHALVADFEALHAI
jgi:hypothetical protein